MLHSTNQSQVGLVAVAVHQGIHVGGGGPLTYEQQQQGEEGGGVAAAPREARRIAFGSCTYVPAPHPLVVLPPFCFAYSSSRLSSTTRNTPVSIRACKRRGSGDAVATTGGVLEDSFQLVRGLYVFTCASFPPLISI